VRAFLASFAFASVLSAQIAPAPADKPAPRTDQNSQLANEQLLAKAKAGGVDIYFEGDSIVRRWGATDYPQFLANWKENFFGWNAGDFGWGADRVENVLWRLENGELDDVNPKVIVLLAGTNNVGSRVPPDIDAAAENVIRGLRAVVNVMREKAPKAVIVVTAIFPRGDNVAVLPEIAKINAGLVKMADGKTVRYLDINSQLADADGMLNDRDKLHPQIRGYQVWADALKPIFAEILGPPAASDHAPAPTGDPSAKR
jgi:lysophospholipase L1-like esterase